MNPSVSENASFKETQQDIVDVRSQMPPLAPLGGGSKPRVENVAAETKPLEMPVLSNTPVDSTGTEVGEDSTSPKGAAIGDRSKRFSRDRLRATIDSPCPIPPMTPLTPAMTPVMVGIPTGPSDSAGASKEGNSASSTSSQPIGSNVFLFPPTHISRRVAALRLQGHTTDHQKLDKSKSPQEASPKNSESGNEESNDTESTTKKTSSSSSATNTASSSKTTSGSLNSAASLGYISESILQGDNALLVDLSQVKNLPLLSLPSAGWSEDANMSNVAVNQSSPTNPEQQLKTPTQVLHTPTQHVSTPVQQLHTPTQPLNTPTQALHTPTQPLNTPTQPLNTPNNDLESPANPPTQTQDYESPVKVLMQPPAGKKRKTESDLESEKMQKTIRFHHFTPSDFKGGEVNVSQFRKPSEFVNVPVESDIAKRRRKPRKQNNPQNVGTNEVIDVDGDKSDHSADDDGNEKVEAQDKEQPDKDVGGADHLPATMQYPLQTPSVLQRITPIFNLPTTSSDDQRSNSQTLNTPVFIHSAAFMTPSSRLSSSILHRASPAQSISSTPQFFTFMPTSGFQTPTVFFTPPESADKTKSAKSKPADQSDTDKPANPLKRSHMTLTFAQPSSKDDPLQTPSKIAVVTPTANKDDDLQTPSKIPVVTPSSTFNPTTAAPQIFSFQDSSAKQDKSKQDQNPKSSPEKTSKSKKSETPTKEIPKLVVEPPSDGESEKQGETSKDSSKSTPKETATDQNNNKPPTMSKQTLHRVRSGGKGDLVLSLSPTPDEGGLKSPLNTPSGIKVITPTMATTATPKLGSPLQRLPPGIRVLPPSMMMAPMCVSANPTQSTASGMQVHTPTLFHIISPSQATPPSPSVLVYPFGPRGFAGLSSVRNTGPLSCGSLGSSPGFNLLQRGTTPVGGGSGSLLKSALMKTWPVFQFPPRGHLPSETEEKTPEVEEGFVEQGADAQTSENPTNEELRGKLSGANDPCLSEAAENI
nr:flocculation protein FLO11 [Ciona intestinalis]|eukprot:XP_002123984.1 flocculation protein FLO11 [Ciona intestinalis]